MLKIRLLWKYYLIYEMLMKIAMLSHSPLLPPPFTALLSFGSPRLYRAFAGFLSINLFLPVSMAAQGALSAGSSPPRPPAEALWNRLFGHQHYIRTVLL